MRDYIDQQKHLYIAHKTSEISNKSVCIEEIARPTFEDQLKMYRFNQNNVSRSSNRTNLEVNSPEISWDQFTINKEINQRRQQRQQSSQPFNKATQRELGNNNKATYQQRKQRQQYRRRSSNRANQKINSQEFFREQPARNKVTNSTNDSPEDPPQNKPEDAQSRIFSGTIHKQELL